MLLPIGQYLKVQINSNFKNFPKYVKNADLHFLGLEGKPLQKGTVCKKKQSIAFEILNRNISFRVDLRSTVQAAGHQRSSNLF